MPDLQTPTNALLDKYITKFKNDENAYSSDQALRNLFATYPDNKKLEDILLKASVINTLYSTNILGIYKMAKHIQSCNIDEGIKKGDPNIVNEIATGHEIRNKKSGKEIYFYSFATKYCNWHNPSSYGIYDSFVEKVLMAYKRQDKFSDFTQSDLKDFSKFKNVLADFAGFYGLTKHNLKDIDKFLWVFGKDRFPTTYSKKDSLKS